MDNVFDLVMGGLLNPDFDAMPITDDDYLNEADGLIYCSECKTPKQMKIDLLGNGEIVTVKVLCDCQSKRVDLEEQEDRKRKRRELIERNRESSIHNEMWRGAKFENDDTRDLVASNRLQSYADNFDQMLEQDAGLLLYGGLGSGKTFLAACVANKLLEDGCSVIMTNLTSLIANVNSDFGADREYWIERLMKIQLLILDDFGVERTTEYAMEQSYEIINTRYKSGKPLIITTNLTLQEMQKEPMMEKRRIYDRVIEKCIPILVQGDSRRREIADRKRRTAMEIMNKGNEGQGK